MAEPSAETVPGAGAREANVVLATKLYLPRLQSGFVPRPRLAAQLDEALARDLILVCAPAGFGKTSCWPVGTPRPAASCLAVVGQRRRRPGSLLAHVVAGLDPVWHWFFRTG